ncbi:MAG: hypothetical protein CMK07_05445 [Ponticaulis sp.]|nr:hypothetical protein [Ponticaulis sp.]
MTSTSGSASIMLLAGATMLALSACGSGDTEPGPEVQSASISAEPVRSAEGPRLPSTQTASSPSPQTLRIENPGPGQLMAIFTDMVGNDIAQLDWLSRLNVNADDDLDAELPTDPLKRWMVETTRQTSRPLAERKIAEAIAAGDHKARELVVSFNMRLSDGTRDTSFYDEEYEEIILDSVRSMGRFLPIHYVPVGLSWSNPDPFTFIPMPKDELDEFLRATGNVGNGYRSEYTLPVRMTFRLDRAFDMPGSYNDKISVTILELQVFDQDRSRILWSKTL